MARRGDVMHYTWGLCKGRRPGISTFRGGGSWPARPAGKCLSRGLQRVIEPSSSASHINFDRKETTLAGDPLHDERSRVGRFGADGVGPLLGPRGVPGFRCGQRLVGIGIGYLIDGNDDVGLAPWPAHGEPWSRPRQERCRPAWRMQFFNGPRHTEFKFAADRYL